jgi:Heterokaryon incompatibility protein (HET)
MSLGSVPETLYEYKKLQRADNIRLFELQPGARGDPIKLRLYEHDTSDAAAWDGHWAAISYVWGDPTNTVAISCNDRSLNITVSLWKALELVRYSSKARVLWADSICINQKDLQEKSAQIPLMSRIYANASQVEAYLGEDQEGIASTAFFFIDEILAKFKEKALLEHDDVFIYFFGTEEHFQRDLEGWNCLAQLTRSQFFHRAWIIQELGLARGTMLRSGLWKRDLKQLISCLADVSKLLPKICQKLGFRTDELIQPYKYYKSWPAQNHSLGVPGEPDFLQVLYATRDYLATDPRDYIYALLGHPSARSADGNLIITPDYTREAPKVFTDFATAWIKQSKSLRILSCVEHDDYTLQEISVTSQPSWAPTLAKNYNQKPLGMDPSCGYAAATLIDEHISIDSDEAILKCRGVIVDKIDYYSDPIKPEYFVELEKADSDPRYFHFVEELWDEMVLTTSPPSTVYRSHRNQLEAFVMTLMAASSGSGRLGVATGMQVFERFYSDFVEVRSRPRHPLGKALEAVEPSDDEDLEPLLTSAFAKATNRRFFRTDKGYFGLGPDVVIVGGRCCVLLGSHVPHLLYQMPDSGRYILLGEAYIHGLMDGEAMKMWEEGALDLCQFEIL